jgi:hypothetical protein
MPEAEGLQSTAEAACVMTVPWLLMWHVYFAVSQGKGMNQAFASLSVKDCALRHSGGPCHLSLMLP